ncbi:MAG: hypothetical protein NO110_07320, partial [Sulfolobales archaeon]|nr:hypothetical protein [Sulfolobales archaeon]
MAGEKISNPKFFDAAYPAAATAAVIAETLRKSLRDNLNPFSFFGFSLCTRDAINFHDKSF